MNLLHNDSIAVVDVETTGLSPWAHDRIVEIAVIIMGTDGAIKHEYETLVNPVRDIGPLSIHRITTAEVLSAPQFRDIAGDIAELLSGAKILSGHNVRFDRNFLIAEFKRVGITMPNTQYLCTCQLLGGKNLAACCREFGIEMDGDQHRALHDARATSTLLKLLIENDPTILTDCRQSEKWPTILPLRSECFTRDSAQKKLHETPRFLQRIRSVAHPNVDAATPNVEEYLTLLERVLEDRTIDCSEENMLVDSVDKLRLTLSQVADAHRTYLCQLAVQALSDGVITEIEKTDLFQAAHLLGYNTSEMEQILKFNEEQLQSSILRSLTFAGESLAGKTVCFTGELQSRMDGEQISREIAERCAQNAGLFVANSVTKKLDLLIVADPNTQSGKAKKARHFGVRILSEVVFWRMIGVPVE